MGKPLHLLFLVKVDEMMGDELVVYDLMIYEFGLDESIAFHTNKATWAPAMDAMGFGIKVTYDTINYAVAAFESRIGLRVSPRATGCS
jgi:hypothetical protein